MFTIDYSWGNANLPRLLSDDYLVPDYAYVKASLKSRTIKQYENGILVLADNLDSIVEFVFIGKNGKLYPSRAGCFNTTSGDVAIIEVRCFYTTHHYKLAFIKREISKYGLNIKFFKITEFPEHEVYYVPYELDKREQVLRKLQQSPTITSIEEEE